MSEGAGYISPDALARIGAVIDRDGLLDGIPSDPDTQRTNADEPNPADANTEPITEKPGEPPVGDPPGDDEPLAADGEKPAEGAQAADADITSISAMAAEFDVDEDTVLTSIQVDNGMGYQVSLGDALNGWRENTTNLLARQESLELEFSTKLTESNERVDTELRQLGALASVLAGELNDGYDQATMDSMRTNDPAGYADMIDKRTRRQDLIKQAVEKFDLTSQDRTAQVGGDMDRLRQREATMLAQKMPHWAKDREAAQEVVGENTALMRGLGYSDDDIANVIDHRHIMILHWAAQWRKSLSTAKGKTLEDLREKKGLRRPGMVKRATARIDQGDPNQNERKSRLTALRKTASTEDAGHLIESFLKG